MKKPKTTTKLCRQERRQRQREKRKRHPHHPELDLIDCVPQLCYNNGPWEPPPFALTVSEQWLELCTPELIPPKYWKGAASPLQAMDGFLRQMETDMILDISDQFMEIGYQTPMLFHDNYVVTRKQALHVMSYHYIEIRPLLGFLIPKVSSCELLRLHNTLRSFKMSLMYSYIIMMGRAWMDLAPPPPPPDTRSRVRLTLHELPTDVVRYAD